jgi:hypothetical protein
MRHRGVCTGRVISWLLRNSRSRCILSSGTCGHHTSWVMCHCVLMRRTLSSVNDSSIYSLSGLSEFLSLNSILVMAKMFKLCSVNGTYHAFRMNLLILHWRSSNILGSSGCLSVNHFSNRFGLDYCGIRNGCLFHKSCIVDVSCWHRLGHNCRSSKLRLLLLSMNISTTSLNCREWLVQST